MVRQSGHTMLQSHSSRNCSKVNGLASRFLVRSRIWWWWFMIISLQNCWENITARIFQSLYSRSHVSRWLTNWWTFGDFRWFHVVLIDAVLNAIIFNAWLFFVKWHKMATSLNIQLCKMYYLQTQMCRQSTESINLRPTPGTAPGPQLSGEVSYFFVSPSIGLPTLTNQRVSSSVFKGSPIINSSWKMTRLFDGALFGCSKLACSNGNFRVPLTVHRPLVDVRSNC